MFFKKKFPTCGVTTLGERGQIVIPQKARESLGVKPGDKFFCFIHPVKKGVILVHEDDFNPYLAKFFGSEELEETEQNEEI